MTLSVFTARISSRDPDRLDITRKSGGHDGIAFAPSWSILSPALSARAKVIALRLAPGSPMHEDADRIEAEAWSAYVPAYVSEMRVSYRRDRATWDALLARERAVLACYCVDPAHCHRTILAGILGKLGAVVGGEVAPGPVSGLLPAGGARASSTGEERRARAASR